MTARRARARKQDSEIAALLRAGATYAQVYDALSISHSPTRIARVRREHGIPTPDRRIAPSARTPEDTYRLYARASSGHLHWTGPWAGRMPEVCAADDVKISALRVGFRLHYGRDPEGRVRRNCGDLKCVAGPHLTDRIVRTQRSESSHT
jgi:hypothetical protein